MKAAQRTSVTAWMEAPCFSSSSITLALFFLQAMWSGVKPFCTERRGRACWSSEAQHALTAQDWGGW